MAELAIVYAVFPSAGEAHDCCRNLLQERLVACANRLAPVISHYRWEGEIESGHLLAHGFSVGLDRLTNFAATLGVHALFLELLHQGFDRIAQLHRHKVPAILAWPAAAAHPAFALWVNSETCA